MCVCVCVCDVCVCVHVRCIRMYVCMYVYVLLHTYVHTYVLHHDNCVLCVLLMPTFTLTYISSSIGSQYWEDSGLPVVQHWSWSRVQHHQCSGVEWKWPPVDQCCQPTIRGGSLQCSNHLWHVHSGFNPVLHHWLVCSYISLHYFIIWEV